MARYDMRHRAAVAVVCVVPVALAGTWAATLPNYPELGLYAGRYRLRFGPGATMHYVVPGVGAVPPGVSVTGNRVTFIASGVCKTPGRYLWKVDGRTLTFTVVGDRCRKRVTQLLRRWSRIR